MTLTTSNIAKSARTRYFEEIDDRCFTTNQPAECDTKNLEGLGSLHIETGIADCLRDIGIGWVAFDNGFAALKININIFDSFDRS